MKETRKTRAAQLLKRLRSGPCFSDPSVYGQPENRVNTAEASRQFRNWSESWILDELKYLIPELREK